MNQKIEWYKEVLEIEPNSKVFFPLARILAADQQTKEAIDTLVVGLGRHPYFIEARLLLVELLFSQGRHDLLWKEVDQVSDMLGGYPGFWRAWAERLSLNENSRDAALAVTFVTAFLQKMPISWSEIIEQGLMACFAKNGLAFPLQQSIKESPAPNISSVPVVPVVPVEPVKAPQPPTIADVYVNVEPSSPNLAFNNNSQHSSTLDDIESELANEAPEEANEELNINLAQPTQESLESLESFDSLDEKPIFSLSDNSDNNLLDDIDEDEQADLSVDSDDDLSEEDNLDNQLSHKAGLSDDEELEEVYSLRTRSMAGILAEQGDFLGAREIYLELMSVANNESELLELKESVEEMQKLHEAQLQGMSTKNLQTPSTDQSIKMNEHVMDKLKKLVDRLEVRSQN